MLDPDPFPESMNPDRQLWPGFRIPINLSCWIRIRIQIADPDPDPGGQKWPQKNRKKDRIFIFWSAWCSLLRAEGFSCSLRVFYGGLGISKLQFLIKKIKIKFLVVFSILDHQTLDPDPGSGSAIRKNAGSGSVSGSALNQCGSETLTLTVPEENQAQDSLLLSLAALRRLRLQLPKIR